MDYNNDFKYDLKLGQQGETIIAKLLNDSTIEVKTDFIATRTGNLYIEFMSRGKPSGIATTQAKYWIYIILKQNTPRNEFEQEDIETILFFKMEDLKKKCKDWLKFNEPRAGGDSNTSLGCLISIKELF